MGKKQKIRLQASIDNGGAELVRVVCSCRHSADLDILDLIAKLGPDATFTDVERVGKCSKCGTKGSLEARPLYGIKRPAAPKVSAPSKESEGTSGA